MVLKALYKLNRFNDLLEIAENTIMRAQGKIPFKSQDLESMVGHEFYMVIAGTGFKRRMDERGVTKSDYGHILEITSRMTGKVEGYKLGQIMQAKYEDGSNVSDKIRLMESLILTLDDVDLSDQEKPVLLGVIQHYRGVDNYLYEEKRRVNIYLDQLVKYKSLGRMVTI